MPFDLEAARKSGKTDAEIAAYLGNIHGFDTQAALKAGKTPTLIAEYLSTHERPGGVAAESEDNGLLTRISEDLTGRAKNIASELVPSEAERSPDVRKSIGESIAKAPRRALHVAGEVAGGIGDVIAEPIKSVAGAVIPESVKQAFGEAVSEVTSKPGNAAFIKGVSEAAKRNPEITKDLIATANIAALLPAGKLAPKTGAGGPWKFGAYKDMKNIFAPPPKTVKTMEGLAEKFKIPTTLGEATGNVTLQKSETLLEKVPVFGIRKFREKQLEAADKAAKNFLAKYVAEPDKPDFWGNKEFVDGLYKNVEDTAKTIKVKTSAMDTLTASEELMERYPSIFQSIQDQRTKKVLTDVINTADTDRTFTFDDLWMLRKGLGIAKETARGQGNIEAVGVLGKLKTAVDSDIDAISNISRTGISDKLKAANEAYKKYNVKYEMIRQAYDKAVGKVGAGEIFSPKKFSTELKNMVYKNSEIRKNRLFKPQEIEEISGLANIMQAVKRAGQFAENPPTGNRAIDLMMTGGAGYAAVTNPGALAGGASAAGILKFLTTTERGKRLALAASQADTYSRSMRAVLEQVNKNIPRTAAIMAIQPVQQGSRANERGQEER